MSGNFFSFSEIKTNLKLIYSDPVSYLTTVISALLISFIMFYFTTYRTTAGNLGYLHANTEVVLQIIISLIFGVYVATLSYRIKHAKGVSKSSAGGGTVGSFLGVLVSGCPACGITIASYLGLSSFISALPFYGIELKILSLAILGFSAWTLLNKPFTCSVVRVVPVSEL